MRKESIAIQNFKMIYSLKKLFSVTKNNGIFFFFIMNIFGIINSGSKHVVRGTLLYPLCLLFLIFCAKTVCTAETTRPE